MITSEKSVPNIVYWLSKLTCFTKALINTAPAQLGLFHVFRNGQAGDRH